MQTYLQAYISWTLHEDIAQSQQAYTNMHSTLASRGRAMRMLKVVGDDIHISFLYIKHYWELQDLDGCSRRHAILHCEPRE